MPPSPSRPTSKPKSNARFAAKRFGRRGELIAAWFLRLKGYRIVATRVKTPVGEIDLVAHRLGTTVFVEVKTRAGDNAEAEALHAVDQRRIARAAQYYVARHPALAKTPLRFDVIFLAPRRLPRHVVNAFGAT